MPLAHEALGLLGLGSNVGERRTNLQAAVDALPRVGVRVLACSSTYDTDPVGEVLDQPTFLNACVRIHTALAPLALLDAVKSIESQLGRAGIEVRHGPRAIDIDILLLGEGQLSHPRMSPAPRAAAQPPLRARARARARLRATRPRRQPARRRARRAAPGGGGALGRLTAARPRAAVSSARGAQDQAGVVPRSSQLARRSSVGPSTCVAETMHSRPWRSQTTTLAPSSLSSLCTVPPCLNATPPLSAGGGVPPRIP